MPAKKHRRRSIRKPSSAPAASFSEAELDILKVFVKSALRPRDAHRTEVTFGFVRVNFSRQEWYKDGSAIVASAREFRLLRYFLDHEGEVVSREQLLHDVWKFDGTPDTRSVDNYILALRKKIEVDPSAPKHLLTLRGAGYKFVR